MITNIDRDDDLDLDLDLDGDDTSNNSTPRDDDCPVLRTVASWTAYSTFDVCLMTSQQPHP